MIKSATRSGTPRRAAAGFSMLELVVSICVMLILTALAIPSLLRSMRAYQLNSAAASVSDMLKFTRFEAVRRNTQINFLMQANGTGWFVGTDSNNSGALDPVEKQQYIAGYATLLPAGTAPPPNAISVALGGAALTTLSGANGTVTFDARGAVRPAIGATIATNPYVFYVGNANDADSGYRAVVLLPSGSTQTWTAPPGGPWRRVA
ncbi:MAG TPA: GspH/FimT family pseudopilin [Candidatus Acidoferrum sp.]|nr:GspH/FimT family pseudopilin [Candidatus Acidoferrum sp.]